MAVTVETLKAKIERIRQELDEVSAGLEELAGAPAVPRPTPAPPEEVKKILAKHGFVDSRTLQPLIDAAFIKMGIDITQPALTPEEVQEMMLREGVRPEDNILSRGIIEAREE